MTKKKPRYEKLLKEAEKTFWERPDVIEQAWLFNDVWLEVFGGELLERFSEKEYLDLFQELLNHPEMSVDFSNHSSVSGNALDYAREAVYSILRQEFFKRMETDGAIAEYNRRVHEWEKRQKNGST